MAESIGIPNTAHESGPEADIVVLPCDCLFYAQALIHYDFRLIGRYVNKENNPIIKNSIYGLRDTPGAHPMPEHRTMTTKNVVFIDSRVAGYETLIAGLSADAEWYLLDANQGGVDQMQRILAGYSELDSVQVISHGSIGTLYLGSTVLNGDNLTSYQTQLQAIGSSLTETGDILLYGCNVAQGDLGVSFVNSLAQITGADVAASDDVTGATSLNGDWDLEISTGSVIATIDGAGYEGSLGTTGNDSLVGGEGNDTISGLGGNDTLSGLLGDDYLDGGDGLDSLLGGDGNDSLLGGLGNDILNGGNGNDTLRGEDGDDRLTDSSGVNLLDGGLGNDTIIGGWPTTIIGGDGDDSISGGSSVTGGAGNDWIGSGGDVDAGAGSDTIDGGGYNAITWLAGTEDDSVYIVGAWDRSYDWSTDTYSANPQPLLIDGGAGSDTLFVRSYDEMLASDGVVYTDMSKVLNFERIEFVQGDGSGSVNVTLANQTVLANQTMVIVSSVSDSHLSASALVAGKHLSVSGVRYVTTGAGNDTITGALTASGGAGNDSITGTQGNDTLTGGTGNDMLNGGDGADTAVFSGNYASYTVTQAVGYVEVNGADGTDRLYGFEKMSFSDRIVDVPTPGVSRTGTTGNDSLAGGSGSDTISGLGGNDTLSGLLGDDYLDGGDGLDSLLGGMATTPYWAVWAMTFLTVATAMTPFEVKMAMTV
jgi:Ca2+-binding RTX toxin-like protein